MSLQDEYRELMAKPIEEVREDIFFRPDNFREEPWYGDFQMFLAIGVCQPPEEYTLQVRKALKVMGTILIPNSGRVRLLSSLVNCSRPRRKSKTRTGRSNCPHSDRSIGGCKMRL